MAISEHGTFSGAAKALDTVQSNVSAHIARLEKELGTVLVDRANGTLTDEGEMVLTRAR
ncbi:MAG: LysR family transcriptional regulator, partial [Acidimicrobiaceae bacterium]